MKKLLLIFAAICFSVTLSAQDWVNTIFGKSLEKVNINYKNELYKGQISNKKRNGMGICKWANGSMYVGDFSNGEINGYGMQLVADVSEISNCKGAVTYVGNWKNGVKSGEGTCYGEEGNVLYFGNFENDAPVAAYPSKEDFSIYCFLLFQYGDGSQYLGEMNNGALDGYGVFVWDNGDLWFGNFKNGQRKGLGIYLYYNAEWAMLDCEGDNYTQITSSIANAESNKANKASFSQVFSGMLSDFNNSLSQMQALKSNSGSNSGGDSSSGGSTGGGCNCANLQTLYTRAKQQANSSAGTYGHSRGGELGGAATAGQYGDNSASNAALKAAAGQNVRTNLQEMQRLESEARKCGCTLH